MKEEGLKAQIYQKRKLSENEIGTPSRRRREKKKFYSVCDSIIEFLLKTLRDHVYVFQSEPVLVSFSLSTCFFKA